MGCGQSEGAKEPTLQNSSLNKKYATSTTNNFLFTMIGNTSAGSMILGFSETSFEPIVCKIQIPRYCNAIIHDKNFGYVTGGIEDLEANVNIKATIDFQIFEGVVSKKFISVNLNKLTIDPQAALQMLPQMINSRYAHCAIENQGHLYVLGGRQYGGDENGLLSACEKFDFGAKKWKPIPSLQYPRAAASVITYGGHIYVFGGYSGNNTRTRIIESYSDGDSSWRKVPFQLHEGLQGSLVVKKPESECCILIFGGKANHEKSNRVVEINFDKSTILSLPSLKQCRSFHKGKLLNNDIFIVGGGSQHLQIYNCEDQISRIDKQISYLQFCSIKQLNSFSQFQDQINLTYKKKVSEPSLFQNKVYIFGHSHESFSKIINTNNLTVMSDGQSLYHNFFQFASIFSISSAVARVNKEHSFVMGGISSDMAQVSNAVYSFNMKTQEIKYLKPLWNSRYAFASAVLGSYLYVIGGRKIGDDDAAILNQCERFSFQSYEWEPIASLKYKRQSPTAIVISSYIVVFGGYKGSGVRSNEIQVYIEAQNRWVELDAKFELAIQSMSSVSYQNIYYLFGGRVQQSDIQKVFKLNIQIDEGLKFQKFITLQIEPVGNLSYPGTNLKIFVNNQGLAYVFGNIPSGIDIYDIKKNKVVQTEQLGVFQKLTDKLFQSYTLIY